jgi:hypothetical protein
VQAVDSARRILGLVETAENPSRPLQEHGGVIAYAEVDPDYTKRADPSELLPVLDGLAVRRVA